MTTKKDRKKGEILQLVDEWHICSTVRHFCNTGCCRSLGHLIYSESLQSHVFHKIRDVQCEHCWSNGTHQADSLELYIISDQRPKYTIDWLVNERPHKYSPMPGGGAGIPGAIPIGGGGGGMSPVGACVVGGWDGGGGASAKSWWGLPVSDKGFWAASKRSDKSEK